MTFVAVCVQLFIRIQSIFGDDSAMILSSLGLVFAFATLCRGQLTCGDGYEAVDDQYCVKVSIAKSQPSCIRWCNHNVEQNSFFDIQTEAQRSSFSDFLKENDIPYVWTTGSIYRTGGTRVFHFHELGQPKDAVRQPNGDLVVSGRQNSRHCIIWNPFVERYQRRRCKKRLRCLCVPSAVTTTQTTPITSGTTTETTTSTSTTVTVATCPSGFDTLISGVNKCYRVYTDTKTHDEAQAFCESLGTHLLEPTSSTENDYEFFTDTSHWIGIHDSGTEGNFVYESTGAAITYENWGINEPNNLGSEQCVMKFSSNFWNDDSCDNLLPFVCETAI